MKHLYSSIPDEEHRFDDMSMREALLFRREEMARDNKVNMRSYGGSTWMFEVFYPISTVEEKPRRILEIPVGSFRRIA